MQDILLLKIGETVLKGLNRSYFEQRLETAVKRRLKPFGDFKVATAQSTVTAEPVGEADMDGAFAAMQKVFGVVSVSRAAACAKDADAIAETAIRYLAEEMRRAKSFKVESKRADKRFPMTSIQLSQHVGGLLAD
ncbi:MAG: THUMP domain-containing protein, partial [Firmicutes bacterium]|nr:THUMP domain-containing protein [Bacillota bacterium]